MNRIHTEIHWTLFVGAILAGIFGAFPSYGADIESKAAEVAKPVSVESILALKAVSFEVPDSMGIRMIRIEKGTVTMGSPADEPGRSDDEQEHTVTISRPFYMAETEVTQEQYIPVVIPDYKPMFILAAAYGFSLPEVHSGGPFNTVSRNIIDSSKHPMEGVVWEKAVEFCNKITERERKPGRLPEGYVYRLPTEAEWEYACRAGSTGRFNVEGDLNGLAVAGPNLENTKPVREGRKPNAWGLYDMHGNVYELCLDWYGPYNSGEVADPVGPATGEKKVARGGCYLSGKLDARTPNPDKDQRCLRSAARGKFLPDFPLGILGFRPVLAPVVQK
jgi:formylglycine-generating enzyme required for sulfatase activity